MSRVGVIEVELNYAKLRNSGIMQLQYFLREQKWQRLMYDAHRRALCKAPIVKPGGTEPIELDEKNM